MELVEALEHNCSSCRNKRAKSKDRCRVYDGAVVRRDPAIIAMLDKFMDRGMCKGYVNGQGE